MIYYMIYDPFDFAQDMFSIYYFYRVIRETCAIGICGFKMIKQTEFIDR